MSVLDESTRFITEDGERAHLIPSCQTITDSDNIEEVDAESCDRRICNSCQNRKFAGLMDL